MKNSKTIVIVSAKKGGFFVNAEVKDPKGLETLINRPPAKGSITRVASVRGTRPGACVIYWRDTEGKTAEAKAEIL